MNKDLDLNSTLGQDAFYLISKKLMRLIGDRATLLLSFLISRSSYWENKSESFDGWFHLKKKDIMTEFGWGRSTVEKTIKFLKDNFFIKTEVSGVPRETRFYVEYCVVFYFLTETEGKKEVINE